jgi:AcrR family transcriptional regulator
MSGLTPATRDQYRTGMSNGRKPAKIASSTPGTVQAANGRGSTERGRDAEQTREDILSVATEEFAEKGLSGARIDQIAERTSTSKRMIYYYFGGKDGLYRAVLQREYTRIRYAEMAIGLERFAPEDALARLVRATFDSHIERPTFVRLVMNENIHHAEHLKRVEGLSRLNEAMIDSLSDILRRGAKNGVFRRGIDPVDLHINITALCFYTVSNRYTFREGFGRDLGDRRDARKRRAQVADIILRWCAAG